MKSSPKFPISHEIFPQHDGQLFPRTLKRRKKTVRANTYESQITAQQRQLGDSFDTANQRSNQQIRRFLSK